MIKLFKTNFKNKKYGQMIQLYRKSKNNIDKALKSKGKTRANFN